MEIRRDRRSYDETLHIFVLNTTVQTQTQNFYPLYFGTLLDGYILLFYWALKSTSIFSL